MSVASLWSRLAGLAATPRSPSDYVELVRTRRARVDAVRLEANGVRTLTLRPGRGWRRHRAGQHVRVGVAIDGRIATRTYSISSSPDRPDGRIEIQGNIPVVWADYNIDDPSGGPAQVGEDGSIEFLLRLEQ